MTELPRGALLLPEWLTMDEQSHITHHLPVDGWELGQQATGYEKFDILGYEPTQGIVSRALAALGEPILYDAWLLRYPTGSSIPSHIDPAMRGMNHIRLNAIVRSGTGGMLKLSGVEVPLHERDGYIFRPDQQEHSVSAIEVGPRILLSVGANVKRRHIKHLGLD